MKPPILYSFRRCPYAIRARLALAYAGISVELREILLRNKPPSMLAISPKGTVPVLSLTTGNVLDESLEIMLWALKYNDPLNWRLHTRQGQGFQLIQQNDDDFKFFLDRYKYADRYPEFPAIHYRHKAENFIAILEKRLETTRFLCADHYSLADAAIFPFIRQFSKVDENWFADSPYPALREWLDRQIQSALFLAVMEKYKPWAEENPVLVVDFSQ